MPIPTQKQIHLHIASLYPEPQLPEARKDDLDAPTQAHVDTWRSLVEAKLTEVLAWTELTEASPAVLRVDFPTPVEAFVLLAASRVVDELFEKGYDALSHPDGHIAIRIR